MFGKTRADFVIPCLLAGLWSAGVCLAQPSTMTTADGLGLHLTAAGRCPGLSVQGQPLPRPSAALGGFTLLDVEADRNRLDERENLLPNGSFELDAERDTLPDGWTTTAADGTWTRDATVARTGTHSMKVMLAPLPEPGISGSLLLARRIPVAPHREYRLSFWVKTEDAGGRYAPAVYVRQFDAAGNWSVPQQSVTTNKGTHDWTECSLTVRIAPETVTLDVYANIWRSHGTAWFDDFRLVVLDTSRRSRVVDTTLTGTRDRIEAAFADADAGLRLDAVYLLRPGRIRVDIEVEDLRKTDRRVTVGYMIPLTAEGWDWWDNICRKRQVTEPVVYRWTARTEMGDGALSIYPFTSLGNRETALTLGVPLDQGPRIWTVGYDHANRELFVNFHLALSQKTAKFPGKATCSFILYRHDPEWGMRAAAKRFYEFYPEHFLKRFPFEAHMNYGNLARLDSDTGTIAYRYGSAGSSTVDGSDYGESIPWFVSEHGGYHGARWPGRGPEPPPTDDEVRAYLERKHDHRSLAQITHDSTGAIRYHVKRHGGPHAPKEGGWFFELRVHEDPEIGDWVPRRIEQAWTQWREKHPDLPRFHVKMSSDEIMGYCGTGQRPDYRVDHLPYTDVPLSYEQKTLVLGRVNLSYDLLKTFYWPHSQANGYLVTGNANSFSRAFCCPYVDCGMVEWEWDRADPLRTGIYSRTMSYQKLWRFWRVLRHGAQAEKDPEAVRLHLHRCLHWAMYPAGLYALNAGGRDEHADLFRHLYRRYEPIVEILSGSGWEPITHALSANPDAWIERYGYFSKGSLHFAVRNTAREEISTRVTVDERALGIVPGGTLRAWDLTRRQPVPLTHEPGQTAIGLRIPPEETRVIHLADTKGRWLQAMEQLRRGIDRLERHYWSQTRNRPEMSAARVALAALQAAFAANPAEPTSLARAMTEVYRALASLRHALDVSGTINRDKMFYRVLDEFSAAPAELLGLQCLAPNDWPGVRKGHWRDLTVILQNIGTARLSDIQIVPECPFPDATLQITQAPSTLEPAARGEIRLRCLFPHAVPRNLAPVMLRLTARSGPATATLCRVLDIRLLKAAELALQPLMLNSGPEPQTMTLNVTNPVMDPLELTLDVQLPAGWKVEPPAHPLHVPGAATLRVGIPVIAPDTVPEGRLAVNVTLQPKNEPAVRQTFGIAAHGRRPRLTLPTLPQPPRIDGTIEADAWTAAAEVDGFTVLDRHSPSSVATRVRLGRHGDTLFIAFHCAEPRMNELRARITKEGDSVWSDDSVETWLAPGHASATQLIVNPLGTRGGAVGLGWSAAAQRADTAWTAELSIPLRELAAGDIEPGEIWGIQLCRSRKAGEQGENSTWSPGENGFKTSTHFGDLIFE